MVTLPQRGQVGKLTPGVVTPRVVPQQVAHGVQAEDLGQLVGRPGTLRHGQRFAERGHTASIEAAPDNDGRFAPGPGIG